MAVKIGSNISSLQAQRRLGDATTTLSKTYERLSSGQRINRASDDAAGLAIAKSLDVKAKIFGQAVRNINDGISVTAIADSTIGALTEIAMREKELATQSANGTYSNKQRQAMDKEAQELAKEYFRVSRSAQFNGQRLFDGSMSDGLRLQLGVGVDGSIKTKIGGSLGTGSFGSSVTFATETGTTQGRSASVTLGDVNGDGILDLVTAGYARDGFDIQGQASVLMGRGDGTFGTKLTFATDTGAFLGRSRSVTLGDVNGDGILDLVTAGEVDGQGQASVLLGRGDGTFGTRLTFATDTGAFSGRTYSVTLGDVNGDGILDLVTAGAADNATGWQGQASVLLGRGDGTFGTKLTFETDTAVFGGQSRSVTLGDVNGDGILDIVTAGYANGQGQASVLLGRGDGTFRTKLTFETDAGAHQGYSQSVTLGDVNGDGILDLVTAGETTDGFGWQGQASALLGRGDGTFGTKVTFATDTGSVGGRSRSVTLGDVNGDGILDLVTAGQARNGASWQGQTSVLLGRGDGTFETQLTFATDTGASGGYSYSVTLGDVNGDGIPDLVTAGYANNGSYQGQASVLLGSARDGISPIEPFSLKTKADALQALGIFDKALRNLASIRGTIGANQSRLETALGGIVTSRENYIAAGSRITDADVPNESAVLVRTQILQQAAASVLAQANQQPEIALQLLRG